MDKRGEWKCKILPLCHKLERKNNLKRRYADEVWEENPSRVKEEVKKFFDNRFIDECFERPKLDGVQFSKISNKDNAYLIVDSEKEEVKVAIRECDSLNSLRLDCFDFLFVKEFWNLLKVDILRFLKDFHGHGTLPRGTNSYSIALISKRDNPQSLGQFRLISVELKDVGLDVPKPLRNRNGGRDQPKYCHYHCAMGHDTDDCFQLKNALKFSYVWAN